MRRISRSSASRNRVLLRAGTGLLPSAGPAAVRGALLAGLSTLAVRSRLRGAPAPLAGALVTVGGLAAGAFVTEVSLRRRRSHCLRLIPSASQGCSLDNDR